MVPAAGSGSAGPGRVASSGAVDFVAFAATFFATGFARPFLLGRAGLRLRAAAPDLGRDRLVARRAGDRRGTGQAELDAAARCVHGLHHERPRLVLGEHVTRPAGLRLAHCAQRDVAAHAVDVDERAVGRERIDGAGDLGAGPVIDHELEERRGLVDGFGLGLVVLLRRRRGRGAAVATAAAASTPTLRRVRFQRARGGLGDRLLHLLRGLVTLLRLLHGLAAHDPAHRAAQREDPADAGNRLRADEPSGLEQPLVLRVELLERVVREDGPAGAVRDLQQEPVTATHRAGRRRHDPTRGFGLGELGALRRVDAVLEARVDDDGRHGTRMLRVEGRDRLFELGEAGFRPPFRREVRSVDHEVVGHQSPVTLSRSAAISRRSL